MKSYIRLEDLEVYQLSRTLSRMAWDVYQKLDWQEKKIMGDQFIQSMDSVGANIAEGYKRFHYLDRIRFYYNSRASLSEASSHWLALLFERKKIDETIYTEMKLIGERLAMKLNNFISSTYQSSEVKK